VIDLLGKKAAHWRAAKVQSWEGLHPQRDSLKGFLMSVRKRTCPQQMGDAAAVKDVDELGKIGERARQPVDLVNNDHVDLACLDIGVI
jgi:hypothetical protein